MGVGIRLRRGHGRLESERRDDWEARIIRHVVDAILGNLVVEEKRATKIARAVFETYARTGDLPPLWPEQSERPDTGARES